MTPPFESSIEAVTASFNRVRILVPPPGLDEDIAGRSGYRLLGAEALRELVAESALPSDVNPVNVVNHALRRGDRAQRAEARAIARRFGRRLGALLWVVRRGDEANRPGRPEWAEVHWRYWAGVRRVLLGGGLLVGPLGEEMVAAAAELLASQGMGDLALRRAPWPAEMVLVGLGLLARPEATVMPVIDCGQTWIKRARAHYAGGTLIKVARMPALPADCGPVDAGAQQIREHFDYLADVVAESIAQGGAIRPAPAEAAVAVAARVVDGRLRPDEVRSCYGRLQTMVDDLEQALAVAVEERLARPTIIHLMNDADAAALLAADLPHTIAVTLGTAIGTGVPRPRADVRAFDTRLRVV
jgi:hypothetical protein